MKWVSLLALIICSCSSSTNSLSKDQQGLFTLSQNFTNEYEHLNDSIAREKLVNDYTIRLQNYLLRSCDSSLEGMKVQMTKLEEDGSGKLRAEFTDNNCKYFFRQVYSDGNEMKNDIVYRFIKSLKKNTGLTLRFLYAGNAEVNDPENNSGKKFEIEIIPIALTKNS